MTRLQSILFLILWVPGLALAQVQHLGRYELEHNWDNIDYVVISQEENGVLIVQPQLKGNNKQYPVVFHHLDKQLNFLLGRFVNRRPAASPQRLSLCGRQNPFALSKYPTKPPHQAGFSRP